MPSNNTSARKFSLNSPGSTGLGLPFSGWNTLCFPKEWSVGVLKFWYWSTHLHQLQIQQIWHGLPLTKGKRMSQMAKSCTFFIGGNQSIYKSCITKLWISGLWKLTASPVLRNLWARNASTSYLQLHNIWGLHWSEQ